MLEDEFFLPRYFSPYSEKPAGADAIRMLCHKGDTGPTWEEYAILGIAIKWIASHEQRSPIFHVLNIKVDEEMQQLLAFILQVLISSDRVFITQATVSFSFSHDEE
jgi:hypothetical protein